MNPEGRGGFGIRGGRGHGCHGRGRPSQVAAEQMALEDSEDSHANVFNVVSLNKQKSLKSMTNQFNTFRREEMHLGSMEASQFDRKLLRTDVRSRYQEIHSA